MVHSREGLVKNKQSGHLVLFECRIISNVSN